MKSNLQRIRERRADIILENELWDFICGERKKSASKTEAKLTRASVIYVLSRMISRLAAESQGYK